MQSRSNPGASPDMPSPYKEIEKWLGILFYLVMREPRQDLGPHRSGLLPNVNNVSKE